MLAHSDVGWFYGKQDSDGMATVSDFPSRVKGSGPAIAVRIYTWFMAHSTVRARARLLLNLYQKRDHNWLLPSLLYLHFQPSHELVSVPALGHYLDTKGAARIKKCFIFYFLH